MDRFSYDPNSRITRRIKERERKKRRNRKIRRTILVLLVIAAVLFGAFQFISKSNISIPEFNPIEGFHRLVSAIKGEENISTSNTDDIIEEPEVEPEPDITPTPEPVTDNPKENVPVSPEGYYPAASENNNLLDIFKTAEGETEKICCLTFDDGPNKATTPEILDILAEYDIKATFFELGEKLEANKDIAKRTYDEGHLLANHTYTQKYSIIYTSWDTFWAEVQKTETLISEITGQPAYKLVRMPGGSFNSGVYGSVKQEYRALLAENGYYFIDWSVDNGDDGTRNASDVLNYVKDYCGSKPVVLLMEDATARRATVESLKDVIEYLKSCGYVFKRLDEIRYYSEVEIPEEPTDIMILPYDTFTRGYII